VRVIEEFVEGKAGSDDLCEDLVVVTGSFAAVIDGATSKTAREFDGLSGGRFAAQCLGEAFTEADPGTDLAAYTTWAGDLLAERISSTGVELDLDVEDGPSASLVAYSANRKEIWRVGDCSWMSPEGEFPGGKEVDEIAARARAALLHSLLAEGISQAELLESDPGREMIMPLLRAQHVFRNDPDPTAVLGYGAVDGRLIPGRFQEVWSVSPGTEIVLQSDGYPELAGSLADAERLLEAELTSDPLRIGRYPSTKGVKPGARSFDDRAYLRFVAW
jgi:hypothetical protein